MGTPKLHPEPLSDGALPFRRRVQASAREERIATTYRCDTCGAYDPRGGGYWPIDGGPWFCRVHFASTVAVAAEHSGKPRIQRALGRRDAGRPQPAGATLLAAPVPPDGGR